MFEHKQISNTSIDEIEEIPDRYPEVPEEWSKICTYCGIGDVELEGYANWYSPVYRCWFCSEAMTFDPRMKREHWRHQIDPLMLNPLNPDLPVRYPERGENHQ
ncbi:hypothetical protein [Natrinema sp. H-ect4]|uniref:hypothetical protein n=1 Tax=Natrinema sp. H-ect4 TaxID=3242699 RepID=UPI0035A8EAA4